MDNRSHAKYKPEKPADIDGVESLISQCYPVVQERVDKLTALFLANAQALADANGRTCFISPAGARAVVLAMVALTDGEILND